MRAHNKQCHHRQDTRQEDTTHTPPKVPFKHAETPRRRTCAIETETLHSLRQHSPDTPPRHHQIITDTPPIHHHPPSVTKTQQQTHTAQQQDKHDRPQRQCPDMSALHRPKSKTKANKYPKKCPRWLNMSPIYGAKMSQRSPKWPKIGPI